MEIIEKLLTVNPYSRPGIKLSKVNAIVVHYVGNPGSSATGNRNYFESLKDMKTTYASSHYIIGLEGEIIRCVPENEIAYCSNNRNSDTLSVENCHQDANGRFNNKTMSGLVALCADICVRYNLSPTRDIIRHYDVTGKLCPIWYVKNPADWETFKKEVAEAVQSAKVPLTYDRLIAELHAYGIIASPGYWLTQSVDYLDLLMVNALKKINKNVNNGFVDFEKALGCLVGLKVINTPDYWRETVGKVQYLRELIINIANKCSS